MVKVCVGGGAVGGCGCREERVCVWWGEGGGSIHCFCWGWSWSSSEYSSEDEEDPPPKNFDIPKLNFKLCVVDSSSTRTRVSKSVAMGPLQGGGGNEFVTGWIIVGEGIGWRRG